MLLTTPLTLSARTEAEIRRLQPQKIYVLGGPTSVYPAVYNRCVYLMGGVASRVERVYGGPGTGRVETAVRVANVIDRESGIGRGVDRVAFIVNGYNYPDALAAAPVASFNHSPILLTHTTYLDTATSWALESLNFTDAIIIGGPASVDTTVEAQVVSALGVSPSHVRRISGPDRYATAKNVAVWSCGLGETGTDGWIGTVGSPSAMQPLVPENMGVASGDNYPDALAGAVWCAKSFAPLLLTNPTHRSPWIYTDAPGHLITRPILGGVIILGHDYWSDVLGNDPYRFGRIHVFGGSGSVSDTTLLQIDSFQKYYIPF
jgi:hypothetical protein